MNAKEWFQTQTDKYSKFDEKGIPTHTDKGKEITVVCSF